MTEEEFRMYAERAHRGDLTINEVHFVLGFLFGRVVKLQTALHKIEKTSVDGTSVRFAQEALKT